MNDVKRVDAEDLEEKYISIIDQISQLNQKILKTTNRDEITFLIEQRKPRSAQLGDIFQQIKGGNNAKYIR